MTMSAQPLRATAKWDRLEAEMFHLHQAGFSLLPLGDGRDGKAPVVRFANTPKLPFDRIIATMHRFGSLMFGIRLQGHVVLDLDQFDEDLLISLTDRFGPATVHVRTPLGVHLYFLAPAKKLPNLRSEGLPVDVKSGPNVFVAGPGSIRPTGEEYYYASEGRLGETELTQLKIPPSAPLSTSSKRPTTKKASPTEIKHDFEGKIKVGSRNKHLVEFAAQVVRHVADLHGVLENLRLERDAHCQDPETVAEGELEKIAAWAWQKRLDNSLYQARQSSFQIDRVALDRLAGRRGGSDAISLYVILIDQHGHCPGKAFTLIHDGMRYAGLTDLSRDRFRAARQMLEDSGLLKLAHRPVPGRSHARFRLMRPVPNGVLRLPK